MFNVIVICFIWLYIWYCWFFKPTKNITTPITKKHKSRVSFQPENKRYVRMVLRNGKVIYGN